MWTEAPTLRWERLRPPKILGKRARAAESANAIKYEVEARMELTTRIVHMRVIKAYFPNSSAFPWMIDRAGRYIYGIFTVSLFRSTSKKPIFTSLSII